MRCEKCGERFKWNDYSRLTDRYLKQKYWKGSFWSVRRPKNITNSIHFCLDMKCFNLIYLTPFYLPLNPPLFEPIPDTIEIGFNPKTHTISLKDLHFVPAWLFRLEKTSQSYNNKRTKSGRLVMAYFSIRLYLSIPYSESNIGAGCGDFCFVYLKMVTTNGFQLLVKTVDHNAKNVLWTIYVRLKRNL